MPTVSSLLADVAPEMAQVQSISQEWVCDCCLGPVHPDFRLCFACGRLENAGVPRGLLRRVIPISVAIRPGAWYNRLATYKAGHPEFRAHLAAVVWAFVEEHRDGLSTLIGGEITAVTPVPSKRGRTFANQPLRQALAMIRPLRERLVNPLTFVPAPDINWRRDYYPGCFDPAEDRVDGDFILMVEDTWVTGATALSAAGALLRDGAQGVAIMPIGRVIDISFWEGQGNPYLARVSGESMDQFTMENWQRR